MRPARIAPVVAASAAVFAAVAGLGAGRAAAAEPAAAAPLAVAVARADCEREFVPEYAQSGKDVIWIPTPDVLVRRMLTMAGTTARDLVVDLGAGDGKIAIAAARDFGARARGVEYDPRMVRLADCYARAEGVAARVEFVRGDIFALDFADATVVTMYLLPELTMRLRPRLAALRPGTRIVSNAYHLGDWGADETVRLPAGVAYLWIVPATVAGQWRFEGGGGTPLAVSLTQAHQRVAGKVLQPGGAPFDVEGRLRGTALELEATGRERWRFEGVADGDRLAGTVRERGAARAVDGRRTGR